VYIEVVEDTALNWFLWLILICCDRETDENILHTILSLNR